MPEPHVDAHDIKKKAPDGKVTDAHLWMVGLKTAIGISLHNFPEGIAVYVPICSLKSAMLYLFQIFSQLSCMPAWHYPRSASRDCDRCT